MKNIDRFNFSYLTINNAEIFVAVSKNINKELPLLVVLHGGPGMVLSPILDNLFPDIEKHFNIVYFDQRGAGLSYTKTLDSKDMTLNQLVEDVKEITLWAKKTTGIDETFLFGHSWGATLGIYTVQKYPHLFSGFINLGTWLVVEEKCMETRVRIVSEIIQENNYLEMHRDKIIKSVHDNFYWADDILLENGYKLTNLTNTWDYQMGLVENSELYSEKDQERFKDGMVFSEHLYSDVINNYNVPRDVQSFKLPTLFIVGENDLVTPAVDIGEYIVSLKPLGDNANVTYKTVDNSRHYSFIDNYESFIQLVLEWGNKNDF
jgi:pimeloyl-ACP methyl ester carboxylesterase